MQSQARLLINKLAYRKTLYSVWKDVLQLFSKVCLMPQSAIQRRMLMESSVLVWYQLENISYWHWQGLLVKLLLATT